MAKGFFYQNNGRLVVLKDKRKLLADIDEAVRKAPVKAKSTRTIYNAIIRNNYYVRYGSIIGFSETDVRTRAESGLSDGEDFIVNEIQVPARSVEFKIGGNCKVKVFNEKGYLTEFRKKVEKTQETVKRPVAKARKMPSFRPVAGKLELMADELMKVKNRKGWFTDGHILVKGEIPKGKTVAKGKPVDGSQVMAEMAYDRTRRSDLQYYCLTDPDIGFVVSRNPVLQFTERQRPLVVFKVDGRYVAYYQGKFRVLANRFLGAEYRIHPDSGMLVAYERQKPVACVMPCREGDRCHKEYPTQMYVPPLRDEAIEAGFLKEKRKALEI